MTNEHLYKIIVEAHREKEKAMKLELTDPHRNQAAMVLCAVIDTAMAAYHEDTKPVVEMIRNARKLIEEENG